MEVTKITINKEKKGSTLNVRLSGRLDTSTAPELQNSISADLEEVNELVMDLKELDYISSAGLRVLLSAHKKMSSKGGMTVINVSETVMEVFDITGFSEILVIK